MKKRKTLKENIRAFVAKKTLKQKKEKPKLLFNIIQLVQTQMLNNSRTQLLKALGSFSFLLGSS